METPRYPCCSTSSRVAWRMALSTAGSRGRPVMAFSLVDIRTVAYLYSDTRRTVLKGGCDANTQCRTRAPRRAAPSNPYSPRTKEDDMSQLIRDYLELVWNQGRTDLADRFLADDLIQHNPNLPDG